MTSPSLASLRPHQQVAIDDLRQAIASGSTRPMVQMPTGAGKTVLAAHIVHGARGKSRRVSFCVPSLSLIDQTFERFASNGIDPVEMGVIQGDHVWRRAHAPIQICSAQTLARRDLPIADVVVIDEAHVRFEIYDRWMSRFGYGPKPNAWDGGKRPLFIGLTATPWAKGLGQWYDALVKPTSMTELIAGGYLSPFRVFAPSHPDLVGVKTVAGDYAEYELGERMSRPQLVADVVTTWLAKAEGRRTLCFCVNRAHAQLVAEQFSKAGIPTAYVDANTPREERDAIGRRLGAKDILVVVNIGCLTTGVDWHVECISLARPTKSEMLFCIDSETEILTSHGWKGMGDVHDGDCVAALDRTTGNGVWSRVTGTIEREMEASESWIEYDAPRANFRVTDQHNMLFRSDAEGSYRLAQASDMLGVKGSIYMPTAVEIPQPGVPLTDAELYFIGMMMTDGTWGPKRGGISQSERHPEILKRIDQCLADCGIGYSKSMQPPPLTEAAIQERFPRWRYSFSAGSPKPHGKLGKGPLPTKREWQSFTGVRGFRHLLPYLDKDLAPALMALSKSQFIQLVKGIFDGDGSKKLNVDYTPRSMEICSARKVVVDRLQALAAIHGMTANVREEATGRTNPIWVITITPKDWRSVGGYASTGKNGGSVRNPRPQVSQKPATAERVWCVQTEAGTIVTRRRGKVTVMGNCQIIGRGLRTADGKDHCLILDHSDTHLRLGMVTDIDHDELDDGKPKPKSKTSDDEDKVPLPRECKSCTGLVPASMRECPCCGEPVRNSHGVIQAEGELQELTPGARGPRPKPTPLVEQLRAMGKPNIIGQLYSLRDEWGKSESWVNAQYRAIFDVWPRGLDAAPPVIPTYELRAHIRMRNIAYRKQQEALRAQEVAT